MDPVIKYIADPAGTPIPSVTEIRETLDRYPWFSPARVLLYRFTGNAGLRTKLAMAALRSNGLLNDAPSPEQILRPGTNEIIDRFLQVEPQKISASESTTEEDKAETSATDSDDEMVSEELAMIYAMQGATERAKEIYLKLSLLYPEKSVYFAELIAGLDSQDSK